MIRFGNCIPYVSVIMLIKDISCDYQYIRIMARNIERINLVEQDNICYMIHKEAYSCTVFDKHVFV